MSMGRWALALLLAAGLGSGLAHGAEKKDPPKEAPKEAKDPKTMTLDELEAAQLCPVDRNPSKPVYHFDLGKMTYHFCTRACQKKFEAAPATYGGKPEAKK